MAKAEAKYTIKAVDRTADGLQSASSRLERFRQRSLGGIGATLRRLRGPFVAIGAVIGTWILAVRGVANEFDDLAKTAKDFGVTVEELENLRLFADLQGTDLNTLLRISERLGVAAERAADARTREAAMFQELGIDAERFAQLGVSGRIATFAAGLRGVSTPARAQVLRTELAGPRTGRVFAGDVESSLGRAGALVDTSRSAELARDAERFSDAVTELTFVLDRMKDFAIGETIQSDLVVNAIEYWTRQLASGRGPDGLTKAERRQETLLMEIRDQRGGVARYGK